jgi:diaminopimelate epimerase
VHFAKLHGLGNDFVLMEGLPVTNDEELSRLARRICDRNFGVGADGLILVLPGKKSPFKMRVLNADGSEAEMCGNGIRCFAKYVYERSLTEETEFEVETMAGIIRPRLLTDCGQVSAVCVDMGRPIFKANNIPVQGYGDGPVIEDRLKVNGMQLVFTAVSMGNPHVIIEVNSLEQIPWRELGPKVEHHSAFPHKTNVHFVQLLERDRLLVKVWERGAGPTLACGTGACAVVAALTMAGRVNRQAWVVLPGGELWIEWKEDDHIYMTGPATHVFDGTFNWA